MKFFTVLFVLLAFFYFGFIYLFDYKIESPDYEVINKLSSNIELRQYGEYYQAHVSYDELSESQAFTSLFNFISGENSVQNNLNMTAPVKLDMTAPVKLDMTAPVKLNMTAPVKLDMTTPVKLDMTAPVKFDNFQGMAFVMPSDFNPNITPNNSKVRVEKVEAKKYAVIRFSGLMRSKNLDKYYSKLKDALSEEGIEFNDSLIYAGYNGPYVLPFMRRNEIWLEIL